MVKVYLTDEQARVGVVAGMWTQQDIDNAKTFGNGNIKHNYYLAITDYAPSYSDRNGVVPNS